MKYLIALIVMFVAVFSVDIASADRDYAHKVDMCHKGKIISIDNHAIDAHLAHGDTMYECFEDDVDDEDSSEDLDEEDEETLEEEYETPKPKTGRISWKHIQ